MHQFILPTRIVSGLGTLDRIGELAAELRLSRPLVVTDQAIGEQAFFQRAVERLRSCGLDVAVFPGCGIDARLHHIDEQAAAAVADGRDGVVGVGGGSVICTAKGIAIAATNGAALARLRGVYRFNDPLPMIMVPTTAGSGSEVSQWTLVKDDERHEKFSVGGVQAFPDLAILDPVTLETLPRRAAAMAGVDALTHAVEAYFTREATPITDALALAAARDQFHALVPSIIEGVPEARMANLMAATMANMACGAARLGLGHALSMPLEAKCGLPHAHGVGPLLLPILSFNAEVAPRRVRRMAEALGIDAEGAVGSVVERVQRAFTGLFETLDLPARIPSSLVDRARLTEMATLAVTALARGAKPDGPITEDSPILCPNIRTASVREGVEIYAQALGS